MIAPTHRLIVKRLMMGIAASVLLLSSYIASYMIFWWAENSVYSEYADHLQTVFVPLDDYCYSGLPGSTPLKALVFWSCNAWRGSFAENYEIAKEDDTLRQSSKSSTSSGHWRQARASE